MYEKAALHSPFSANYQRCIHLFYAYRQRCLYGCSCWVCILQIALTISVIRNTEDIEQLNEETTWLRTKLKGLENIVNPYNSPESAVPAAYHGEAARGTWECVKCGTVNKAGTDVCQSCGAAYSAEINPTSNPFAKKKPRISRFVK